MEIKELYRKASLIGCEPHDEDRHRKELLQHVHNMIERSLYDLYEYMGQFPDDLNLAVMYERIKEMNNRL